MLPGPVCELRSPGGAVCSVRHNASESGHNKEVKKLEVALLGTQDSGQLSTVNS